MKDIIEEFFACAHDPYGDGYFAGDWTAVKIAASMKPIQRKKYRRYGEIPGAFYFYLIESGIIPAWVDVNANKIGRTKKDFTCFLRDCLELKGTNHDVVEQVLKMLLIGWYPDMQSMFPADSRGQFRKRL